jgi:hypothetical protein
MKFIFSPIALRAGLFDTLLGLISVRTTAAQSSKAEAESPKVWRAAELVGVSDAIDAFDPQIAIDANGNALAAWLQSDGKRYKIWVNRYTGSTGWGVANVIEKGDTGFAFSPQVVFDARDNALLVWLQFDGRRRRIWGRCCSASGNWGPAVRVTSDEGRDADAVQVAANASGHAMAVWRQFHEEGTSIWANRYVEGSGWGTAQAIGNEESIDAFDPQLAMDASGNAITVWTQPDSRYSSVWVNHYVTGNGWGKAIKLETGNKGTALYPQIAMNVSGNAIVVWLQSDGVRMNIRASRYVAGHGWGNAELVDVGNCTRAFNPQIAMCSMGNAIVVWQQSVGASSTIWVNRYTVRKGWGVAKPIGNRSAGIALNPKIGMDADGNALIVWRQSDSVRYKIWSNRYQVGKGWGEASLMDAECIGDACNPRIAMNGHFNIWANTFR